MTKPIDNQMHETLSTAIIHLDRHMSTGDWDTVVNISIVVHNLACGLAVLRENVEPGEDWKP